MSWARLLAAVVVDDDSRAFGGEGPRAGAADPAGSARDEDAQVGEARLHRPRLVRSGSQGCDLAAPASPGSVVVGRGPSSMWLSRIAVAMS